MESNRCLVFLLFGLSMLPKIYSDAFPSLFVLLDQESTIYVLADIVKKAERQNNLVEFFTAEDYPLYNACPKEDELVHAPYALELKGQVTHFPPMALEWFVKGLFGEYDCTRKIKPYAAEILENEKKGFAPIQSQQYDIGFLIYVSDANYNLVVFLTVTLDKESGTIYSVRHKIASGHLLQPDLVVNPRPDNEKNTQEYGYDVDSMYTEANQWNILYPIFGQFDSEHSLIKVQLAPAEDFLLDTWKLSSFTDLNTVSMWKKVHTQWIKIEQFVRKVARERGEDLYVETGTGRILELYDVNHKLQPVYLRKDDQKSAVSKYVWKKVIVKGSHITWYDRAILIVMHNDPYTANQEPICNEGNDYGWVVSNKDFKTGLTYVCRVNYGTTRHLHDEFVVSSYAVLNLDDDDDDDDDDNDDDNDNDDDDNDYDDDDNNDDDDDDNDGGDDDDDDDDEMVYANENIV